MTELLVVVYSSVDGWCVYDLVSKELVSRGWSTKDDAEASMQSRAHRIRQGWYP